MSFLDQSMFFQNLFNGKIVVGKSNYKTYMKIAKLLSRIGIKIISDKTYFKEAYAFRVFSGHFRSISLFDAKCIVSITNGISYKSKDFYKDLKRLIKK